MVRERSSLGVWPWFSWCMCMVLMTVSMVAMIRENDLHGVCPWLSWCICMVLMIMFMFLRVCKDGYRGS